jgi:uncharacterized protein
MTATTHRSPAGSPTDAPAAEPGCRSLSTRPVTRMIRVYQLARSGRPTGCRFVPSCSDYAIGALEQHGLFRGSGLALRRLARCAPWGGHGFDPVPERRTSCTHP